MCLVRDCVVVVTSWTDARISWPRCRSLDSPHGGSGILVEWELARALRHESAAAIRYWWRASARTVWWWRRMLGIGRTDPEGSRRLIQAAAEMGGAVRGQPLSEEQIERCRQNAVALNLVQYLDKSREERSWTKDELAKLGTKPDWDIAAEIGRPLEGVRLKRARLGIANPCDRRRRLACPEVD